MDSPIWTRFACIVCALTMRLTADDSVAAPRLAKVDVAYLAVQPMDTAHGWEECPAALSDSQVYTLSVPGRPADMPGRELHATVVEAGVVLIAATWSYDGNSSGGWKETSSSEQQLLEQGWRRVGSAVRVFGSNQRRDNFGLFVRTAQPGEVIRLHTRKYGPPYLVLPQADQLQRLLEPGQTDTPEPGAPVVAARLAVPTAAEQAQAQQVLDELYAGELREKSNPRKIELANQLLREIDQPQVAAAQQYVLLRTAGELFISAGDAAGVAECARRMCDSFELELLEVAGELLTRVSANATTTERAAALAKQCLDLLAQVQLPADLTAAEKLVALAEPAAARGRQSDLRVKARRYASELRSYRQESTSVPPAVAKLAGNPGDPAANTAVGRFRCFWELDWKVGLPLLALGDDADLKALAEADLQGPDDKRDAVLIGHLWWTAAEDAEPDVVQPAKRQRAAHWYALARPTATGLVRSLLDKRLAEVQAHGSSLLAAARESQSAQAGVSGRLVALNKGDYAVWVNGRQVLNVTNYGDPATPQLSLRTGDVVVIRVDGRLTYRCARITLLVDDAPKYLAVRRQDLKDVTSQKVDAVNAELLAGLKTEPVAGRPDSDRNATWDRLAPGTNRCEWFFGPDKGTYQFAFVVRPEMYAELGRAK